MTEKDWLWDEMRQVGTDYADLAEVEAYDARMGAFRDIEGENRETLDMLALAPGAAVLEIGCGTGRFARAAAAAGMVVTAVDVSAVMLDYVRRKAAEAGTAVATRHAGFLTMGLPDGAFDAAVSGLALHHLPDLWKLAALRNVARALKPGGRFVLRDVVFAPTADEAPEPHFERFAASLPEMRVPAARHVAREFSTYDWIMEGLLRRAGFDIVSQGVPVESLAVYLCRKR